MILFVTLAIASALGLVALALVLILVFVFLILVVLFVLLLGWRLFFEILDEFADDIPVFLRGNIPRIGFENRLVMLEGVLPVGHFGIFLLSRLAGPDQRVGQVVGGGGPDFWLRGGHRLGEIAGRFFEIPRLVGRCTRIKFDFVGCGPLPHPFFKILQCALIVPLAVIGQARSGGRLQGEEWEKCQ